MEFRITIPRDQQVDLWIYSRGYQIEDETRTAVAEQGRRQTLVRGVPVTRTFTITGRK